MVYARKLARERNLNEVKFSRGWLYKSKKRNKNCIRRKNTGYYKPSTFINEKVQEFRDKIFHKLHNESSIFDLDHVANMDETGVPRDSPLATTLELKGTK